MSRLTFWMQYPPKAARQVAELLAKMADEAERTPGAEVFAYFERDDRGMAHTRAAVLKPGARVAVVQGDSNAE